MTYTKCLLGCTDVRYGARIVAILDFWISALYMIKLLSILYPFCDYDYYLYNKFVENDDTTKDFVVFTHLFLIFVFLYLNYCLKETTYKPKIYKINQWLAINTIALSFHILAITYITIKNNRFELLYFSLPVNVIHLCQIYVVKSFYDDEVVAGNCNNNAATVIRTQRDPNGLINLSANYPMIPSQVQNVQHQTAEQHTYVHPTGVCPQLQQQQQPPAFTGPSSEYPQEYYRPPSYSAATNSVAKIVINQE